jgi:hypothetical protein
MATRQTKKTAASRDDVKTREQLARLLADDVKFAPVPRDYRQLILKGRWSELVGGLLGDLAEAGRDASYSDPYMMGCGAALVRLAQHAMANPREPDLPAVLLSRMANRKGVLMMSHQERVLMTLTSPGRHLTQEEVNLVIQLAVQGSTEVAILRLLDRARGPDAAMLALYRALPSDWATGDVMRKAMVERYMPAWEAMLQRQALEGARPAPARRPVARPGL